MRSLLYCGLRFNQGDQGDVKKSKTSTFLMELPLAVDAGQARRLRAHFEVARCLYNTLLGEALKRLRRMREDPQWRAARAMPKTQKQERKAAFSRLREAYGFSEYAMHDFTKEANCTWIADHIDSVMAQTLATRAYQAVNRVCLGKAKKVRFKSRGRGLDSVENKWDRSGMRFILQRPEDGNEGVLIWGKDRISAILDLNDPVVKYGLGQRIKYARLLRRKAPSPKAEGADCQGYRYYVQLVLEGKPYQKPKHIPGTDVIGLDLGPSTLAMVPHEGEAQLDVLCEELKPDTRKKRRLQRKLDRQRRANNLEHYDEKGHIRKRGMRRRVWKTSRGYLATRRRLAQQERKLAAHRKSSHGRLIHEIVRVGNHIRIEKLSYQGWQKRYGKSVGLHAPGMLIDHLRRTVASTGGTLIEVPTRTTKLSQFCHGCGAQVKKPLSERWHRCACGIGPIQRDLYAAFLAAYLEAADALPSCALYAVHWEGAEARLRAAQERLEERAKEGQVLPRSFGISRAGVRLPQSPGEPTQELVFLLRGGRLEAWKERSEPPVP
jgi:transposase